MQQSEGDGERKRKGEQDKERAKERERERETQRKTDKKRNTRTILLTKRTWGIVNIEMRNIVKFLITRYYNCSCFCDVTYPL